MDKFDSLWLLFLSTTLIDLTMWLLWKMFTFHCCKIGQHLPKKRSISKRFYSGYLRRITVSDLFVMIYFSGRKSPNIDQLYFDFLVKGIIFFLWKLQTILKKSCSCETAPVCVNFRLRAFDLSLKDHIKSFYGWLGFGLIWFISW